MDTTTDPLADNLANIRNIVSRYAASAMRNGVDSAWINQQLWNLGIDPIQTAGNEYRINVPVTGRFGKRVVAANREQALAKFKQAIDRVTAAGQITDGHCDNVYELVVSTEAPTFFSGPEDLDTPNPAPPATVEALRAAIVAMLREGVTTQGWGIAYANNLLNGLGFEMLPALRSYSVTVPVAGTTTMCVVAFEDDPEGAEAVARSTVSKPGAKVLVVAEEVGAVAVRAAEDAEDAEENDPDW